MGKEVNSEYSCVVAELLHQGTEVAVAFLHQFLKVIRHSRFSSDSETLVLAGGSLQEVIEDPAGLSRI